MGAQVQAVPWVRQLVIDTGRAARRRHAIHGLFEVDVDGKPFACTHVLRFVGRLRELLYAGDRIQLTEKEPA